MKWDKNIWTVVLIALIIGYFIGQYKLKKDIWTGIYYSDLDTIEDQTTWRVSPPLYSLDECQKWINWIAKKNSNWDYSCSQGCKFTRDYLGETMICRNKNK